MIPILFNSKINQKKTLIKNKLHNLDQPKTYISIR